MYFTKKDLGQCREIMLPESLMGDDRYDFIKIIEDFVKSDVSELILNFQNTKRIDSAGLGFMLIAMQESKDSNKKMQIINLNGDVKKCFDMINFTELFDIR